MPIYHIPSNILCTVVNVELKVEKETDEVFFQITLLPETKVMGYSDTDVAEYLFKAKPLIDALVKFLCNDLTKACAIEPPPVPKSSRQLRLNLKVVSQASAPIN
ncbi:PREDICTED: auxin response factor 11-like [Nelumbo nucifera]|uniref:Auxin response factor 11-like n=1 Tax=Nelumbo nucifera TaxID=4432 RepID=A0A1U8AAU2_NELNU|nr:PREDICTED: auxin response factor 11-like [Nelumbo nucifera]